MSKHLQIRMYINVVGLHSPVKIFSICPFFVSQLSTIRSQNNLIAFLFHVTLNVVTEGLCSVIYYIKFANIRVEGMPQAYLLG